MADHEPDVPLGEPAPYKKIRRSIINTFKFGKRPKRPAPTRPAGLDTRLDAALADELDSLDPSSSEALQILFKVMDSIEAELAAIDPLIRPVDLIDEHRRAVYVTYRAEAEVNNGGLAQLYLNSAGDNAAIAPDLLRKIGEHALAEIIQEANKFFPKGMPPRDRGERLDILDDVEERAADTWNALETRFYHTGGDCLPLMIAWIKAHRSSFFR